MTRATIDPITYCISFHLPMQGERPVIPASLPHGFLSQLLTGRDPEGRQHLRDERGNLRLRGSVVSLVRNVETTLAKGTHQEEGEGRSGCRSKTPACITKRASKRHGPIAILDRPDLK